MLVPVCASSPSEFRVRLILPLILNYQQVGELVRFLLSLQYNSKNAWKQQALPEQYIDNLYSHWHLFQMDASPQTAGAYFRFDSTVLSPENIVFRDPRSNLAATLEPESGIELTVSQYGTAVLSISLKSNGSEFSLSQLADFVRNLHFGKPWLDLAPDRVMPIKLTVPGSPVTVRNFPTLVEAILGGLDPWKLDNGRFDLESPQRSFSVYVTARFPDTTDFTVPSTQESLLPALVGISANWPSDHCGITPTATNNDASLFINRKHWASVSAFGATHFIADQSPLLPDNTHPYNIRRMDVADNKLFMSYAFILHQRLALQAFSREARTTIRKSVGNNSQDFLTELAPLKRTLLQFSLDMFGTSVSEDDTVTRYYEHCRRTLRLDDEADRLNQIFADIDSQARTREVVKQTEATAHHLAEQIAMQEKVEWIEVFVITVYALEMGHVLGESFFPHDDLKHSWLYPGATLCMVAVVTMFAFLSALNLWVKSQKANAAVAENVFDRILSKLFGACGIVGARIVRGKRRYALFFVFLAIAIHLWVGSWHLKPHSSNEPSRPNTASEGKH